MARSRNGKIFIKGFLFTLPILLTITILIWLVRTTNGFLSQPLMALLPESLHFPGMGIAVAIGIIYLVGLAIHERILRFFFQWLEEALRRIPLVNVIYNNIREMTDFVSGEKDDELERVVLVDMQNGAKLIGFVTQKNADISENSKEQLSAVYLPMSYQMGGYLVYLPESKLETLEISKQEAMQRILTADIGGRSKAA